MTLHPTSGYSHIEETTNAVLHGIGLALAVSGLVLVVVFASLRFLLPGTSAMVWILIVSVRGRYPAAGIEVKRHREVSEP